MTTNTKIALVSLIIAAIASPALAASVKRNGGQESWVSSPPGGVFIYDQVIAFDRERSSN